MEGWEIDKFKLAKDFSDVFKPVMAILQVRKANRPPNFNFS